MTATQTPPSVVATTIIDARELLDRSAAQLDELYRSGVVGTIPTGRGDGVAIIKPGSRAARIFARITRVAAWKGKQFNETRDALVNLVSPFGVRAIRARVGIEPSWVDGEPCIVIDYSHTSWSARWIRDEIREVAPDVFAGVVFLRQRRLPIRLALSFRP
jgi:hypothetical protein